MKTIISLILVILFVLIPFTACADDKEGASSDSDLSLEVTSQPEPSDSSSVGEESEDSEPEESKPAKSAVYSMSLEDIVKSVYSACDKPFDRYINEPIQKADIEAKYGDALDCTEAYHSMPFWNVDPYLFELYRVDDEKADEIAALVEEKADLNQWASVSAEAKIAAVNGNVVMLCMSTKEECRALAEAFMGIK